MSASTSRLCHQPSVDGSVSSEHGKVTITSLLYTPLSIGHCQECVATWVSIGKTFVGRLFAELLRYAAVHNELQIVFSVADGKNHFGLKSGKFAPHQLLPNLGWYCPAPACSGRYGAIFGAYTHMGVPHAPR